MTELSLETLQKRHKDLLDLNESEDISQNNITQVEAFLKELAAAGAYIEDPEKRNLLRAYIRYWSSFVDEKSGSFPTVQLEPFPITGLQKDNDRKPLIMIIAILAIISIMVISSFFLSLLNPMARATQLNCLHTLQPHSFPISNMFPSASSLPLICSGSIPKPNKRDKNKLFTTAPDKWTAIQGDVNYANPNGSQNFVSVKSAIDPEGNSPTVGSLLAVMGTSTIQAPYGLSFDLYQDNAAHQQIGQMLLQHEQNILKTGCGEVGGCMVVSTVVEPHRSSTGASALGRVCQAL